MDFATLQTNLTLWVGALATDRAGTALPVEWGREPQKVYTGPYILAYARAIVPIGHDWPEYDYDDLTDEIVEEMHGARRLTLALSFRNFDQRLGYGARYYAERFRIRCKSTYSKDLLHDYKISFWDSGSLTELDYKWSGRMVNQVEMDLTLGLNFFIEDPDFHGSYIKTVELEQTSGVTDEYGNPVYTELGEPVIEETSNTFTVTADEAP